MMLVILVHKLYLSQENKDCDAYFLLQNTYAWRIFYLSHQQITATRKAVKAWNPTCKCLLIH